MQKLIKIIVVIIFMIIMIFIVILGFKTYHFIIINRINNRIKEFIEQENRIYSEIVKKGNRVFVEVGQIYRKNNTLKYLKLDVNSRNMFLELKNFDIDETYILKNEKRLEEDKSRIKNKEILFDIPNIIIANEKLNIRNLLKIYYIIPVKYNDKECYKIKTKSEIVIVAKGTYLLEYMCKIMDSVKKGQDMKIEYFYKFEVGTVTEENINLSNNLESN